MAFVFWVRVWIGGLAMHEPFGCLDVVIRFGDSETVDAEGVAVRCGWSKFTLIVSFVARFLAYDMFTVGTPVSGSVEEMADHCEFEFVSLREPWGEFEFGVRWFLRMCRVANVGDHFGCSCLEVVSFIVFLVGFLDV